MQEALEEEEHLKARGILGVVLLLRNRKIEDGLSSTSWSTNFTEGLRFFMFSRQEDILHA